MVYTVGAISLLLLHRLHRPLHHRHCIQASQHPTMSGSSRALIKALNNVFEDPNSSELLSEAHSVISQYLDKHNSLKNINQSTFNLDHEFLRIYNQYVEPANLSEIESVFLGLLTDCISVFDKDQVNFWLRCYLRPAIDSAGFDNTLVDRCRDLVKTLANEPRATEDTVLVAQRMAIAEFVISKIIDIYLGDYTFISLELSEKEKSTQAHFERIRFIRRNCLILVQDYAIHQTQLYFDIINKYYVDPKLRLPVLSILAAYLSTQSSQVYHITSSKLFKTLMLSLAMDESESVIICAMSVLCMLVPQISNKLGDYVSDLLYVYIRMALWNQLKHWDHQLINCEYWEVAKPDSEGSQDLLHTRIDIDILHLATLLYGLFPYNFCTFAKNPKGFLRGMKTAFLSIEDLPFMAKFLDESSDPHETPWDDIVAEDTKTLLQSFYLHPKFLQLNFNNNLEEELRNPINWLIKDGNDLLGSEEITLGTLNLNPNIFLSIPSSVTENSVNIRPFDSASIGSYDNAMLGFVYHGAGTSQSEADSHGGSRHSSLTMPNNLGVKQQLGHQYWGLGSKSNGGLRTLSSQASYTLSNDRANSGPEIRFKDVAFDTPRGSHEIVGLSPPGSVDETHHVGHFDSPYVEPIDELLASHEKLYTSTRSPPPDENNLLSSPASGKRASSLLLHEGRSVSIPTTSLETAVVHKRSIGNINILAVSDGSQQTAPPTSATTSALAVSSMASSNLASTVASFSPTLASNTSISGMVDFYQRELLLMKNELEFANYMKLLNKFNFVKLKLNYNKVMRDLYINGVIGSDSSVTADIKSNNLLGENCRDFSLELDNMQSGKELQLRKLTDRLVELQEENDILKATSEKQVLENDYLAKDLEYLTKQVVANKDIQLSHYKLYIDKLKAKIEGMQSEKKAEVEVEERPQIQSQDSLIFIFDLKSKIIRLEEKNTGLVKELNKLRSVHETTVKKFESKLQHDKDDLGENINGYVNQFEKRIKELTSVIMKYETLLDEKNARILHLSTSKPISIPEGGFRQPQRSDLGLIPQVADFAPEAHTADKSESFSSSDSVHSPSLPYRDPKSPGLPPHQPQLPPHMHHSSSTIPVLKQFSGSYAVQPTVRGRGGYQKRSKNKLM